VKQVSLEKVLTAVIVVSVSVLCEATYHAKAKRPYVSGAARLAIFLRSILLLAGDTIGR
jgi:hypothetical protein